LKNKTQNILCVLKTHFWGHYQTIDFANLWDRISVETSRQRALGLGFGSFALAGALSH
jgi:hypothetical protein